MRILFIFIFFLVLGFLLIISNNDLQMYKKEDIQTFSNISTTWANKLYSNLQILSGQIIKLDWLPEKI